MMHRLQLTSFLLLFILMCFGASCSAVKPYQRIYLDDNEMQFGQVHSESFEWKAIHYREAGQNSLKGKASGGCGCN